jgi:hypothetical protein
VQKAHSQLTLKGEKMITLEQFKRLMENGKCGNLNCGSCYPIGKKEDAQLVKIKQLTLEIESLKKQLKEFQKTEKRRVVFNGTDPNDINVTVQEFSDGIIIKASSWNVLSITQEGVELAYALPPTVGFKMNGSRIAAPQFDEKETK